MPKQHEKVEIPPVTSKRGVGIEVGWSKNPAHEDLARVTIGTQTALISLQDLLVFAFKHGSIEQKDSVIPVSEQAVKKYDRQHKVQVTKDMKAGDILYVNCTIFIPEVVVNAVTSTTTPLQSSQEAPII